MNVFVLKVYTVKLRVCIIELIVGDKTYFSGVFVWLWCTQYG